MAPGAMKWVPVNRDEPVKPEKPIKQDKADYGDKQAKGGGRSEGKGGGKGGGKAGKGDSRWAHNDGWNSDDRWDDDYYDREKGGNARGKGDYRDKGYGDDRNQYKVESKRDHKGGGKGADSKGKGKAGGKGKDDRAAQSRGVKTVQELESELARGSAGRKDRRSGDENSWRPRGPDAFGKQPIDGKGAHCTVHKHSGMGVAVVSMETAQARETIMKHMERKPGTDKDGAKLEIGRVMAQLRRHTDKSTQQDVPTDIFVAWGHRAEKESPLEADVIANAFDKLFIEAQNAGAHALMQVAPPHQTGSLAGATLSTTPQQFQGRSPAVPPPPAHLPSVGPHGVPMPPQAPVHPAYHDYAQRAAMYNQYGYGGYAGAHQYGYPPQQNAHMYAQQAAYGQFPPYNHLGQAPPTPQASQALGPSGPAPATPSSAQGVVAVGTLSTAAPTTPTRAAAPGSNVGSPENPGSGGSGQAPKPRLLQITDPNTGLPINALQGNFEPRKASSPLQIINPTSGEAVTPVKS